MLNRTGRNTRLSCSLFYIALLLAIIAAQLVRADSTLHRWFCVDEFEHLHASWCIAQGLVPYRDFFEHHTPLLQYLLAPILHFSKPEASFGAALNTILVCRWIMYALGCLILYLTYRLGREMHSKAAGLMAVVFTLSTMMFIDRTTEIRPDMLSVPAMLGVLILTLRALRPCGSCGDFPCGVRIRSLFFAGLLSSLALLATPKSLFWLDAYCLGLVYLLFKLNAPLRQRLRLLTTYAIGFALPLLLLFAIFAPLHAMPEFIQDNFLLNAHWKFRLNPWEQIHDLAYENPMLTALGGAGLLQSLVSHIRNRKLKIENRKSLLPAISLLALIVGIFIIPVPYTEYFLMLIPLLAIYQSMLLLQTTTLLKKLLASRPNFSSPRFNRSLLRHESFVMQVSAAAIGLLILIFILALVRPPYIASIAELVSWCILPIPLMLLLRKGQRHLALLLLLVMMTLFPLRRFVTLLPQKPGAALRRSPNNLDQLQALAYIHTHTSPTDTVFDGWQHISEPFRPHAFAYFFLHREIRLMLSPAIYQTLLEGLISESIRPKIAILDEDTLALPPEIVQYFRSHYHPSVIDFIWVRDSIPE